MEEWDPGNQKEDMSVSESPEWLGHRVKPGNINWFQELWGNRLGWWGGQRRGICAWRKGYGHFRGVRTLVFM